MKRQRWGWWGGGVTLLAILLLHRVGQTGSPEGGLPPAPAMVCRAPADLRGVGSCAAVACHGRAEPLGPPDVLRNEYTTWARRDRHAEAFLTLYSEKSCALMEKLGGGVAHRDQRCLACHATPMADAAAPEARGLLQDGVGCESCHGPASRWLGPHTADDWERDPKVKETKYGMTDLSALSKRAEICAGCHVGAPKKDGLPLREVNHDLIAAGHPRLVFEFSAFMAIMTPHWDSTRKAPDNLADFPARCWTVGQAVSQRAALALLRDRASRAQTSFQENRGVLPLPDRRAQIRWPEFAEYDCFACHHDLRKEGSPQPHAETGAPPWGTWSFPRLAGATIPAAGAEIQELRDLMSNFGTEPVRVAEQAFKAEKALKNWLEAHENDPPTVDQLKSRIAALEDSKSGATVLRWDDEAQRYLALVPFYQTRSRKAPVDVPRGWEECLKKRRKALAYPEGYDSPRVIDPTH